MKVATVQLVQGGVIRGYVHYIGSLDPIRPLCGRTQIKLCERSTVEFMPTETAANCPRCVNVTSSTPLILDHSPTLVGVP